jgi:hypothetical protein
MSDKRTLAEKQARWVNFLAYSPITSKCGLRSYYEFMGATSLKVINIKSFENYIRPSFCSPSLKSRIFGGP